MRPSRRLLALCVLGCSGCIAIVGFDDFDPNAPAATGTDAAPPPDATPADFQLSATPGRLFVRRGETAHARLVLAPAADADAASAVISAVDTPDGVTTDAVGRALRAGAATDVTVTAAASAMLGGGTMTFHASSANIERTAAIAVDVRGASGTLDETFGDGGVVTIEMPSVFQGQSLGVWPDDAILVAGDILDDDGGNVVGIARRLPSGAPDPAFRGVGAAIEPLSNDYGGTVAAAPLPDGGLVVAGSDTTGTTTYVARVRSDGALDDSFGGGVVKAPPLGPISVLVDGEQIVVIGSGPLGPRIFRRDANGAADTSFGDGGVFDDVQRRNVGRPVLLDGGAIAIPIATPPGNAARCAILEIPRSGATPAAPPVFGQPLCIPAAVAVAGDGRRGLAGTHQIPQSLSIPSQLVVGLIGEDGGLGALDGGVESTSMQNAYATAVAFDDSGRLLVDGIIGTTGFIARFLPDGAFDTSFGTGGRVTIPAGSAVQVYGMAVQSDGRVLIGLNSGSPTVSIVARYWP